MGRRIVTKQLHGGTGGGAEVDTYFDKVLKYIPADINAAWIAVTGLIKSASDVPTNSILWIAFVFMLLLTMMWTLWQTAPKPDPYASDRAPKPKPAITQTVISTIAFAVWVFALGEPFSSLGFYRPLYGSLLLIAYSLIVARIDPEQLDRTIKAKMGSRKV